MGNAPWYLVIARALQLLVWPWRHVPPDGDRLVWNTRDNSCLKLVARLTSLVVLVGITMVCGTETFSQVLDGSAVRAAHIFNFGKYVEWPATGDTAYLKVCTPENSPVTKVLNGAQGKKAQGREVQIIAYPVNGLESTLTSGGCNIIYVGECEEFCGKLVKKVIDKPILVVSEQKGGGVVRFVDISSKVKFAIEKSGLDKAGLKMSSQVLDLAVKDE